MLKLALEYYPALGMQRRGQELVCLSAKISACQQKIPFQQAI